MSGAHMKINGDVEAQRQARLIWLLWMWPAQDRRDWVRARLGTGAEGRDNPAASWNGRTVKKCEDGYGRYLSWLHRAGHLVEDDIVTERITPDRVVSFTATLKLSLSPASVGMMIGSLCSAAEALSPNTDWSWLRRRASRLKLRARPSRDKRQAIQHTSDLYRLGKYLMETAVQGKRNRFRPAQRYQAGLIIALLAALPLRIRNFQAITIGESLRWNGRTYWLTFGAEDTKTGSPIDEPLPDDLIPYLEAVLAPHPGPAGQKVRWRAGPPPSLGRCLRQSDERVDPSHPDRMAHQAGIRDCCLAPPFPRLPADVAGHGPARFNEHQPDAARSCQLRHGPETLQSRSYAGCRQAFLGQRVGTAGGIFVRRPGRSRRGSLP
jgi:hypothetical protein